MKMNIILSRSIITILILSMAQISFAQLKVEDLAIDTSFTNFQFAANFQGTIVYTPNGASDLNPETKPSAFSFSILPNATYEQAKGQIDLFLSWSKKEGYAHSNIVEKDTLINDRKVYYISLRESLESRSYINEVFHAFFIRDDTAVIFISGDLDGGKHLTGIKETFFRIVE